MPPNHRPGRGIWLHPSVWWRILSRMPSRVKSLLSRDPASAMRRLRMKQRAAVCGVDRMINKECSAIPDLRGILDIGRLDEASRARATRHWEALHVHVPRLPPVGRLVLVKAGDEGWTPRHPTLGWTAKQPIEVHSVPGRHEEFLRHHSAHDVARVMRRILEE